MPEEILHLSEMTKQEGLPSLSLLAQEAAAAQLRVTLMLQPVDASVRENTRRRHDIAAALRTLRLTVEALKDGYQFDDTAANAKIRAIEKAVGALGREAELWHNLLPNK